ncbi:carbamoyltransferase family protein [Ahniella affigens]|nr:carbamoyltransferase C-terminal domain-containing protein [Ahniella affigens]
MTLRNLPRITLGIGGSLGHDANAALMVDGRLLGASQQERYSRIKHDGGFPAAAIADLLADAGLTPAQVQTVVFSEKLFQTTVFDRTRAPSSWLSRGWSSLRSKFDRRPGFGHPFATQAAALMPQATQRFAWHHLTHVVGAFFTTDCERAAFLCVDGKGEDSNASIGRISAQGIEMLAELPGENGLGLFYTLTTRFLGFPSFGSEYKVMGLAPYGQPRFAMALRQLLQQGEGGAIRLARDAQFHPHQLDTLLPWVAATIGMPARQKSDPLRSEHADLAASLQLVFEESVMAMAAQAKALTGESTLLFAGGCAQNCVAAGIVRRSGLFAQVINSPVGGDMATGLGAALMDQWQQGLLPGLRVEDRGYYLGSLPGQAPAAAEPYRVEVGDDLFETVAGLLANGSIVAWCRDRMELGARALGARSILADARVPGMQSRLNLAVKFREGFRPFAPIILEERSGEWFDHSGPSRYMQFVEPLRADRRIASNSDQTDMRARLDARRCEVDSVVHVDYTARLQTVHAGTHADMHRLLSAFERCTGVPMLINTSFNVAGEPIVRTASEAWDCFLHTDIDFLVIDDQLFRNPMQLSREEKIAWVDRFKSLA